MPKKHHSKGDAVACDSCDINEMIMLEESAHGTLCSIHQRVNSTDHFPCSDHQMLHLCPVLSRSPSICSHSHVPLKCQEKSKVEKPKRSSSSPGKRRKVYTSVVPQGQSNYSPKISTILTFNDGNNSSLSVKSKSCIYLDSFDQSSDANAHTDQMVVQLRSEIEKVKDQLKCFSLCALGKQKISSISTRPSSRDQSEFDNNKTIAKLRAENRKLKRDLETKKRLLESFRTSIEKAKDILNDYEKKVTLLHQQAIKSSHLMRISKEKFCKCLQDKEEKIQMLSENNSTLSKTVQERKNVSQELSKKCEQLEETMRVSEEKYHSLADRNQTFCDLIESLKSQLNESNETIEKYKESIKKLEERVTILSCNCKKMNQQNRKQKISFKEKLEQFENRDKDLIEHNSELTAQLKDLEETKTELQSLQEKYNQIKEQIKEYEQYSDRCQTLEDECKRQFETMLQNEKLYHQEQDEMRKLIEELTMVVKQNKITLLQMSEINKQQEVVIQSQSIALISKEEKMKLVEKESENYKRKSIVLEQEMESLRQTIGQQCSNEECLNRTKELEKIKNALNMEKDNHSVKEQIIQDQTATISSLQCQITDKIKELSKAQTETSTLENEINKVNGELMKKHEELNKELNEKEALLEKLKVLENQRTHLSEEMCDLECTLNKYINNTVGQNEMEKEKLSELKDQIEKQKSEWETQKDILAKEKVMAVKAANFATQKLVETVADFQKQVDAQRKVQLMLTKMLHSKDEELRRVNSKMSFISQLTKNIELPTKELYRNQQPGCCASNPTTTNSFYSLKSNSSRKCSTKPIPTTKCPYVEIQEVLDMLNACVTEKGPHTFEKT